MRLNFKVSSCRILAVTGFHAAAFHTLANLALPGSTRIGFGLLLTVSGGVELARALRLARGEPVAVSIMPNRVLLHGRSGDQPVRLSRIPIQSQLLTVLDFEPIGAKNRYTFARWRGAGKRVLILPDSLTVSDRKALSAFLRFSLPLPANL